MLGPAVFARRWPSSRKAARCVRASSRHDPEPLFHSEANTRWHPGQTRQPRHQQCPHGPTFDSTSPASLGRSSSRAKIHAAKMAGPSQRRGPRNGRVLAAMRRALGWGEGGTPGSPGPFQPSSGLGAGRRCRRLNARCRHHAPLPPGRALEHKERAPLNDAGSFQKSRGFAPACFFFFFFFQAPSLREAVYFSPLIFIYAEHKTWRLMHN